jgi:DNA-binding NarL/FixJ family response regulator
MRRLRAADLDERIVMLTVSDSEEDVIAALRAGADGYLRKDMEPEDILKIFWRACKTRPGDASSSVSSSPSCWPARCARSLAPGDPTRPD